MRRREPYRSIDAGRATAEFAAEQQGYKTQRQLEQERIQQGRYDDRSPIILPTRTLTFYAEGVTGTSTTVMSRAPKSTTVMATSIRYPMDAAGRVIGASLWSSSAWTAGTAQVQLRISKGGGTETLYLLPIPCIIDGVTGDNGHIRTQSAEWMGPVQNGILFAAGEAIRLDLVLTGWTVSTPDWGAELVLAYDGLS